MTVIFFTFIKPYRFQAQIQSFFSYKQSFLPFHGALLHHDFQQVFHPRLLLVEELGAFFSSPCRHRLVSVKNYKLV